jgi:HlyD family secretion protein
VQHLEGGIVRSVLVRDGQHVKAGQTVLVLGDVGVDADRNRLDYRVSIEQAAIARLNAEQSLSRHLEFPAELQAAAAKDSRVAEALAKENALFMSRRDSLASEVSLMRVQRSRVQQEIIALQSQISQAEEALALQRKEVEASRRLLEEGYFSDAAYARLAATVTDYASKLDERRSELARASQRLVDSDLKIRSLQNQYTQQATDQLKVTAARLGEIDQERRKTEDAAARQVVTAPADGEVIGLQFTSPGAVVRPGEPIAEIVPSGAQLMVEARIRPEDINHVYKDQLARIRFTAYRYRNTSMATGKVTYVSADRLTDRATNQPYYSVIIQADAASLHTAGDLKLQAGMPAEVYIQGTSQTPLEYIADPISVTLRRAGREI